MHRIDSAGAVTSFPTPGTVGSTVGYFTKGNPGSGTPATVVSDDWLNAVQEELISILTAAGLSPSKTAQNQLLSALQAMCGVGSSSVVTITSGPYAMIRSAKMIAVNTSGGNVELDLPDSTQYVGETWFVVKITSDANVANVKPNGSQNINGQNAIMPVDQQWTIMGFTSFGSLGWVIE